MDTCKNCGVEIVKITGRRPKEFCSDNCRAKNWQKKNAKKKVAGTPIVALEKEEPKEEQKPTSKLIKFEELLEMAKNGASMEFVVSAIKANKAITPNQADLIKRKVTGTTQ